MKEKVNLKHIKYIRYHDSLSEVLVERIKKLYPIISEVFPWSLDEWIDGFNYDMHPEGEISTWEKIIREFQSRCKIRGAKTKEQKREIMKEVLGSPKVEIVEPEASA